MTNTTKQPRRRPKRLAATREEGRAGLQGEAEL